MAKRILVSAYLLGENCKYNGGNNFNQALAEYIAKQKNLDADFEVITVCPEVLGGLSTPRIPAEIVNGIVTNKNGESVDREFRLGAERALDIAKENKVTIAVLQSRSPSCGPKEIYDGTFSKKLIAGEGIFAKRLREAGVTVIDVEDLETLLKNEHYNGEIIKEYPIL